MAIDRHEGTSSIPAGASRLPMSVDGRLFMRNGLAKATLTTSEEVLLTLSVPRNAINSDKKSLRVRAFLHGGGAVDKSLILRVGSLTGSKISDTGTAFDVVTVGKVDVLITRVSKTSYVVFMTTNPGAVATTTTITDDLSNGFDLVVTGQSTGSAGDLTLDIVMVDLMPEGGL